MLIALLIALNLLIYFILLNADNALNLVFGLNVLFFSESFYWQLLSSMFLHANLTHLALNMIVLFQFGRLLESFLGQVKFAVLYLLGGLVCSILNAFYVLFAYNYLNQSINLVGASGAICVLMGYFARFDRSATKGLIIGILLMSFVPLLMGVNVAWYAHIFGFILGFLAAKFRLI